MQKIDNFREENYFLSNMCPCRVVYDGMWYQSSESAYQASRCKNPQDRQQFTILNGFQAKKQIKVLSHNADFVTGNICPMSDVIFDKFRRNPEFLDKLLKTGYAEIEEGNTWHDTFWGVDKKTGQGENWLGKILQSVRTIIRDDMKEIRAENLKGNIAVSREFCGKAEVFTADTGKQFLPYQNAVKPEYIRDLLEKQIAVLTGKVVSDGRAFYPLMQFSPEMTGRMYESTYQNSVSAEDYQGAVQTYRSYEQKYVFVQYQEYLLGIKLNENQLVRDIVTAEQIQSRYPFCHREQGRQTEYAVVNISPDTVTFAVLAESGEITIAIEKDELAGQSIGRAVMLWQEQQKNRNIQNER